MWNRSESEVKSKRNRIEIKVKSKWNRSELEVKSIWNLSDIQKWNRSGIEVISKWNPSELQVNSINFRNHLEINLWVIICGSTSRIDKNSVLESLYGFPLGGTHSRITICGYLLYVIIICSSPASMKPSTDTETWVTAQMSSGIHYLEWCCQTWGASQDQEQDQWWSPRPSPQSQRPSPPSPPSQRPSPPKPRTSSPKTEPKTHKPNDRRPRPKAIWSCSHGLARVSAWTSASSIIPRIDQCIENKKVAN